MDQATGRSRGGLTTKIHVIVDAAGKAAALSLTPGQRADITEAEPLLDEVDPEVFIADKAYDADPLIEKLEERGVTPVIPSKKNRRNPRKILFSLYKKRNIIDALFSRRVLFWIIFCFVGLPWRLIWATDGFLFLRADSERSEGVTA
ncbi:hypothetical protein CJF59_14640 (plasmid) [Acetobacter pomorum]|uniref:Transposase IS4-like domain-containing protein n=1 Tax=Acetobacter pomorum TaxID=65959 RepID=A0AAN1PKH1_9PROT|nr:hypothetical protein CJF59_14640 [Acetobacter pomorum]